MRNKLIKFLVLGIPVTGLILLIAFIHANAQVYYQPCANGLFPTTVNGVQSCSSVPSQRSYLYPSSSTYATAGFNTTIPDGVTIWILNSTSLLASGTIVLPANPADGQPLSIECPKGITLSSVQANTGQALSNVNITTCAIAVPYRLKFSAINSTWYPN